MHKSAAVYRVLVACGAWAWVGFLAVAIVRSTVAPVGTFLDNPTVLSVGHVSLIAILALFFLASFVGWVGTLLHVAINPALRSPAQRAIVFALALLLNFGAAFVYYFVYLLWVPKASTAAAAV
jgi:hypothetical protein